MRKVLLLTLGIIFVLSGTSFAFHGDGVAHCNGCHTMHNSDTHRTAVADEFGVEPGGLGYVDTWSYSNLVDPDNPDGNAWLLVKSTPSDVCLSCHSGYGSVLNGTVDAPGSQTPAGNFIFLNEDNLNDGHSGASHPISGDAAGHNINAPGHGFSADVTASAAPGGTFPSSLLGCSSCHDPHGSDDFRMLYGARAVQDGAYTFTKPAPIAEELGSIFATAWSTDGVETATNHTGYQSGMSDWCANCHGDFHSNAPGNTKLIHPTGENMTGGTWQNYNLYNGTDDMLGGVVATSYLVDVPFEDATNTDITSTSGATATSKVMCLTCHRAHASSAPNAGRWDFSVTLLDDDGVESSSYGIPNPYNAEQRSLCNKCHSKDAYDLGSNIQ